VAWHNYFGASHGFTSQPPAPRPTLELDLDEQMQF
jgi:hypothetical protein